MRAVVYSAGGGIGDSLVSSVVAQALRQRYATVDALTLSGHRATLGRVPDYDEVLVDDGSESVARTLAARAYDAIVVTWATAHTAGIAKRSGIPVRVGQARRLYSRAFSHQVVVRSETGDVTTPWREIQLDYARALGCDAPGAVPRFVPTPADVEESRVATSAEDLASGYLVFHPTNAEATKRGIWPTEGWAALARALRGRFALPVLVSGTAADARIVEAICAQSGATPIAGSLGIGAFGALAACATAFAGITTGTMHVAAAVGCPTLGIFPFQSDFPERWAPAGPRTAIVRANYPCHRGDTKERCPDYACIANLDTGRIVSEMDSLLRSISGLV